MLFFWVETGASGLVAVGGLLTDLEAVFGVDGSGAAAEFELRVSRVVGGAVGDPEKAYCERLTLMVGVSGSSSVSRLDITTASTSEEPNTLASSGG